MDKTAKPLSQVQSNMSPMADGWRAWWLLPLVLAALAGCADVPEGRDVDDGVVINISDDPARPRAPRETDVEVPTTARLSGIVLHPTGAPLPDVRVTVLSLANSVITNATGTFEFPQVDAGSQTLRVSKQGYQTVSKVFTADGGKHISMEIVLSPATNSGDVDHYHDHWRGADVYTVLDQTIQFADDATAIPPGCTAYVTPYGSCWTGRLLPEEGRIVPPGTGNLTIDVGFEPGALFDTEYLRLYIRSPPDTDGQSYTFNQQVTEPSTLTFALPRKDIVDNGHALWSEWYFQVSWSNAVALPAGPVAGEVYNSMFRSDLQIRVQAHKDGLELDPPHPRFWDDGNALELEVSEPSDFTCLSEQFGCQPRTPVPFTSIRDGLTHCNLGCMTLHSGQIVAPGTTRVQFVVEFAWTMAGPLAPAAGTLDDTEFVVGLKTADASPVRPTWDDYTWLEPLESEITDNGMRWTYEVPVGERDPDPYYARWTNWALFPAVVGYEDAPDWRGMCSSLVCGGAQFQLREFIAINDNWPKVQDA